MDAADTSSLLVLDYSLEMFLKQLSFASHTPLSRIIANYNIAIDRTNNDPAWKVMKLPRLGDFDPVVDRLSVDFKAPRLFLDRMKTINPQVNFGVTVENFAPHRVADFLATHLVGRSKDPNIVVTASAMAGSWMDAFCAEMAKPQASDAEKGVLALIIAKTLYKIEFFGLESYKILSLHDNHIRNVMSFRDRVKYKNSIQLLPKANLRELISVMPPEGALRLLLENTEFLIKLRKEEEVVVTDIERLVQRYHDRGVLKPVDDDCFVDADRVLPYQRHGDKIAIVMETRFPIDFRASMTPGSLIEFQSSSDAVKGLQDLYGDLRRDDLLPFLKFKVASAIVKLPEYSRVDFNFDEMETDLVEKYVVPLAENTDFLRALRHLVGIHRIDFTSYDAIEPFALSDQMLDVNVCLTRSANSDDFLPELKQYITENAQPALIAAFKRFSKIARKFGVARPDHKLGRLLDFEKVLYLRSTLVHAVAEQLVGSISIGAESFIDVWEDFYDRISGVENGEPGFVGNGNSATPIEEDVRRTLKTLIDVNFNKEALLLHQDDTILMGKFLLIKKEIKKISKITCSIV